MKKILVTIILALAFNPPLICRYDRGTLYFSGQTRVVYGQLEFLCKCPAGHNYWLSKSDCSE